MKLEKYFCQANSQGVLGHSILARPICIFILARSFHAFILAKTVVHLILAKHYVILTKCYWGCKLAKHVCVNPSSQKLSHPQYSQSCWCMILARKLPKQSLQDFCVKTILASSVCELILAKVVWGIKLAKHFVTPSSQERITQHHTRKKNVDPQNFILSTKKFWRRKNFF